MLQLPMFAPTSDVQMADGKHGEKHVAVCCYDVLCHCYVTCWYALVFYGTGKQKGPLNSAMTHPALYNLSSQQPAEQPEQSQQKSGRFFSKTPSLNNAEELVTLRPLASMGTHLPLDSRPLGHQTLAFDGVADHVLLGPKRSHFVNF